MSKEKDDSALIWKVGNKEKLLDTPIFTVNQSKNTAPDGHSGNYVSIDALDWAAVIPVVGDDFLMVKQWRHAYQGLSLEFPGGVIDAGESPEEGAARELLEETGCKAGTLVHLGTMSPNPALFSNRFHVFLAEDLTAAGKDGRKRMPPRAYGRRAGIVQTAHAFLNRVVRIRPGAEIKPKPPLIAKRDGFRRGNGF